MNSYPLSSFDNITAILAYRAAEMGCAAFTLKEEPIELDVALDAAGPMTWALMLHAKALAELSGKCSPSETNALPIVMIPSDSAPLGNEAVITEGRMTMALTLNLLDASLEHAICMGMRHYGYTPEEWDELPYENKVIPIENYLADLQANWITDELEHGDAQTQVAHWPMLMDRASLTQALEQDMNDAPGINRSRALKLPSL